MDRGAARPRGPALLVALLVLPAAMASCGGAEDASPFAVRRLVAEHPGHPFEVESVYRRTSEAQWLSTAQAAAWLEPGDRPARVTSAGLALEPDAVGQATVRREVEVDADRVDGVLVRTSARPGPLFKVYWAPAGRHFTAEDSLDAVSTVESPDGSFESYFPLWRHPGWTNPVGQIRVTAGDAFGRRALELIAVEAIRLAIDDEALARAASGPRLLELDRELRPGLLARSGEPVLWSTEVAPGDLLTFGYGLLDGSGGRATFTVRLEETNALLFESTVGGSEAVGAAGRWHDARIALEEARGAVRLRFECQVSAANGGRAGLPFWGDPELHSPRRRPSRPNILLVSLDTVRPDHLSLYGYDRATTPHLERWAAEATVFEQVVTTAPWTLPAHLSMLTGLDAFHHGVNHRARVPAEMELLPELLAAAGYRTAAVTGGGYLDPGFGLHQGFASYRYYPDRAGEAELEHSLRAALAWLREGPREPWFLFFHTYEPHYPYHARRPFLDRFAGGSTPPDPADLAYVSTGLDADHGFQLSKEWRLRHGSEPERELTAAERSGLIDLYDSGLAYTDEQVARLIEAAEGAGETIVAVTSDHGEALGEHGLAGHAYLQDFNALVPLVVKVPRRETPRRVPSQVRITDLAPTLVELAGLDPSLAIDGRSLVPLLEGAEEDDREASIYASFANRGLALRLGRGAKYTFNNTVWPSLWGHQTLYDLASDPGETRDLATTEDAVERLARRARTLTEEVHGALRVALANPTARPLEGSLRGSGLHVSRLRSPRLPVGAVAWETQRTLALRLPAGDSVDLLLENPPGRDVRLELEPDLSLTLDLDDLQGPVERWLVNGSWSAVRPPSDGAPTAHVAVSWNRRAVHIGDPGSQDTELREQLRALGYIE
jgi:arylsulfatase A-like enzyme